MQRANHVIREERFPKSLAVPLLRGALVAVLLQVLPAIAAAQADWITGPRGVPSSTGIEFFDVFNPALHPTKIGWTADRPARTPRPITLPENVHQLEAGYQYRYRDQSAVIRKSRSAPELLYRYAPLGAVELRIGWTYAWQTLQARSGEDQASGSDNFKLGTKILLTTQAPGRLEQAILLETEIPTGNPPEGRDNVGFAFDYLAGWTFVNIGSLFGSTGIETLDESGDSYTAAHQSLAISAPVGERMQIVLEYVGRYSLGRAEEFNQQSIDLGAAWRPTDCLQFDILAGLGLSEDSDDFFASVGGVLRF